MGTLGKPRHARPFRTPTLSTRLQSRNSAFWKNVEQSATHPTPEQRIQELKKMRRTHVERVRKVIPFLKPILEKSRQIPTRILIKGVHYPITILGVGFSMTRVGRPVVVVLDSAGRGHLFYKSTGINSKMPGKWIPFNGIEMQKQEDGTWEPWYRKFQGHPRIPEYYEEVSKAIKKNERSLSFIETSDIDLVNAVKLYV